MERTPRLPNAIRRELAGTDWRLVSGGKHWHIMVNGKMVGVWPRSNASADRSHYQLHNVRCQIRRALRKEGLR